MECLAAGRGISLPSSATGMAQARGARRRRLCARAPAVQDADRQVRGHRGGARAHGRQPLHDGCDAHADRGARSTSGEKPAVISGIAKLPHHRARRGRSSTTAWTSLGGKGICMGPSNFLGAAYMQTPGRDHRRGRQHPHAQPDHLRPGRDPLPSVRAEGDRRDARARRARRRRSSSTRRSSAICASPCRISRARSSWASPARTSSACPTDVAPETRRYYQQLTRFSAALAFLADVSMGTLGGALKRKEKLSARLGDILSLMYLCSATLQALRGGGPAAGGRAADALGDLGRDVQGAERVRRRDLELPEPRSSPR